MNNRVTRGFVVSSVLLVAVLSLAWLKNETREHLRWQRAFHELTGASPPALLDEPDGLGVAQLWLPLLDRADRCVSCHVAVDNPRLRDAALPFRSHPDIAHVPGDIQRFGCVSCHAGQSFATTADEAHGRTPHWPSPLLNGRDIEGRCGLCHVETSVAEAPALTRGRTLIARLGCVNCHVMGAAQAPRVNAPPLEGLSTKVTRGWLRRWLKNPREVDGHARMPNFQLNPAEIDALTEYLVSVAPSPAVERLIQQARQHQAGDPKAGARVFRTSRCISCHTVDGKGHGSAPDLSQIGSKVSRAWLQAFMQETHALNSRTAMPSYTLSPADLRDLVTYMADELRNFDDPIGANGGQGVNPPLAREGRALFMKYGCAACHRTTSAGSEEMAPDLSGIGGVRISAVDFGARKDLARTLPAWLRAKIVEPRLFGPGMKMPAFALTDDEAADVVTALLALSREEVPRALQPREVIGAWSSGRPPAGEVGRLFSKYRCLSCHQIGELGSDLATAPLTLQGSKTKRDWLARYLVLPETIYPLLTVRMPVLGITRAEAEQMATYISSVYVDDTITGPFGSETDAAAVAHGARVFETKGCRGCHILGQTGGYVGPPLTAAGDRFQTSWIAFWLQNPQRWRREARCPNYGLSREDLIGLSAFLSSQHTEGGRP